MLNLKMPAKNTKAKLSSHVAILRITFGVLWAVNASLKWRSSFRNSFLDQIQSAAQGQPHWLHGWFHFWSQLLGHNPHLFAVLVALTETLIALALLLGLARQFTYLSAAIFSLLIWGVAEGFGGPYSSASTDVGAGIIYTVVFLALYGLERLSSPPSWSIDNYLIKRIPCWSIVASPPPAK